MFCIWVNLYWGGVLFLGLWFLKNSEVFYTRVSLLRLETGGVLVMMFENIYDERGRFVRLKVFGGVQGDGCAPVYVRGPDGQFDNYVNSYLDLRRYYKNKGYVLGLERVVEKPPGVE